MIGLILISLGSLFEEISNSIGKKKVGQKKQSVYSLGVLQLLSGTCAFALITFVNSSSFVFSLASLPTFIPRVILEIVGLHITLIAMVRADRTTFSFIRVGTIPLLLVTDMILGYSLRSWQTIGIILIIVSISLVFIDRKMSRVGTNLVILSTLIAVLTISLFKYNITHFNSVVAEELLVYLFLFFYFVVLSVWIYKENPFKLLLRPVFAAQSVSFGVTVVLVGFAYLFAAASVITAAKRASALLWSLISGNVYFKETNFLFKLSMVGLLVSGLIMLAL